MLREPPVIGLKCSLDRGQTFPSYDTYTNFITVQLDTLKFQLLLKVCSRVEGGFEVVAVV